MSEDTIIESIHARKTFNGCGDSMIGVDVVAANEFEVASTSSKPVTDKHEVIAPEIVGLNADEQQVIDKFLQELNETSNSSKLGTSIAIAASFIVAKAAVNSYSILLFQHLEEVMVCILPIPLINNIIVGRNKSAKNLSIDMQETFVMSRESSSFFKVFSEALKEFPNILAYGDYLYVTNIERISKGVKFRNISSLIITPNQISILTDFWNIISIKNYDLKPIISYHSGETLNESISHTFIAANHPIIKTGTINGEGMAKLCEFLRIEEILSKEAKVFNFM
jgi:enolase